MDAEVAAEHAQERFRDAPGSPPPRDWEKIEREAREQIELIEEQEAAEREAEESDDESTGAEDTTRVLALSEYRPLWEVVATGAPPAVQAQQTRHEVRPQPSDTAEREAEEERIKLIDAVGPAFREMEEEDEHPLSEYWPPWEITRNRKTARDARDHARSNLATQRINVLDGLSQRAQSRDTADQRSGSTVKTFASARIHKLRSTTRSIWIPGCQRAQSGWTQR